MSHMSIASLAGLTAALLFSAPEAQASVHDEMQGVRAAAMGDAHVGLGTSNDTIYLNPAGIALGRRYSLDLQYGFSPFDDLNRFGVTVVDSKSGPVAGALGYTHVRGKSGDVDANLHRVTLGAAYPLSQNLIFGLAARHIRGTLEDSVDGARSLSLYTVDVGMSMMLSQGFGVGLTFRNAIKTDEPEFTPPEAALGLGYGSGPFTLAADLGMDLRDDERRLSYYAGGEYLVSQNIPLRVGYKREPFQRTDGRWRNEGALSGGFGILSHNGTLDAAYTRSLDRPENWSMIFAIKFYL